MKNTFFKRGSIGFSILFICTASGFSLSDQQRHSSLPINTKYENFTSTGFDCQYQQETGKTLLVGIPDSPGDPHEYYSWNKDHFDRVKPHL